MTARDENGEPAPRISVVVVARNEAERIGPALDRILAEPPWELLVVDGASGDETPRIARERGARVAHAAPGRAGQLNLGGRRATGDVCLFLHADTRVPAGYREAIARTLCRPGTVAGAFALGIAGRGIGFRLLERAVAARCRLFGLPYGDQGLFLTKDRFEALGGFPRVEAMEDLEMVLRLRRAGRIRVAPEAVTTSCRRWACWGIVRTTLLHQALLAAYWAGVPARRIAAWRASPAPPRIAGVLLATLFGKEPR